MVINIPSEDGGGSGSTSTETGSNVEFNTGIIDAGETVTINPDNYVLGLSLVVSVGDESTATADIYIGYLNDLAADEWRDESISHDFDADANSEVFHKNIYENPEKIEITANNETVFYHIAELA